MEVIFQEGLLLITVKCIENGALMGKDAITAKKINYDAIIICAGQGGVPPAISLARGGWKTILVEKKHVGGT